MDAGKYKHRITLQQPSSARDAVGQPLGAFDNVGDVWGNILTKNGYAALRADAGVELDTVSIRIRKRSDVSGGWQAVCNGTIYRIEAVLPTEDGRDVDLLCKVVK